MKHINPGDETRDEQNKEEEVPEEEIGREESHLDDFDDVLPCRL